MRTGVWILIAWLGVVVSTAFSSRVAPAWVFPDPAIVVLSFLALRREPIPIAVAALAVGYLMGRGALAPTGVHETALVLTAIGVYLTSGRLAGSGALFFAMVCAGATTAFHVVLFALLVIVRGDAGFSSWATAALVPAAMTTGLLGLLAYRPMAWLETKLTPAQREGLTWH